MIDSNLIPIISSVSMLTLASILHKKKQIKENWTCPDSARVKYFDPATPNETSPCVDQPGPFASKDECESGPAYGASKYCQREWSCINGCSETIDTSGRNFFDPGKVNNPYLPASAGQQQCMMQCSTQSRFGCSGLNEGADGCAVLPNGDGVNDFSMAPWKTEALCRQFQGSSGTAPGTHGAQLAGGACEVSGPGYNCDRSVHQSGDCVRVDNASQYPDAAHGGQAGALSACRADGCLDSFGCFPSAAGAADRQCRPTPPDFVNDPNQYPSFDDCVAANPNCGQQGQYCDGSDPANPTCTPCVMGGAEPTCTMGNDPNACSPDNCRAEWWCTGTPGIGEAAGTCVNTRPVPAGKTSYPDQATCEASGCGLSGFYCTPDDANPHLFSCQEGANIADPPPMTQAQCEGSGCGTSGYKCEQNAGGDHICVFYENDDSVQYQCDQNDFAATCAPGGTANQACIADGCGQDGAICNGGVCESVAHNPNPAFVPDPAADANCIGPGGSFPGCAACEASVCGRVYTCPVGTNTCTQTPPEDLSKSNQAECAASVCGNPYFCNDSNTCEQSQTDSVPAGKTAHATLAECEAAHCGVARFECQQGPGCTALTGQAAHDCDPANNANCFDSEQDCLASNCNNPIVCQGPAGDPTNPLRNCANLGMGPDGGFNTDTGIAQSKADSNSFADSAACVASGCQDRFICDNRGSVNEQCVADPGGARNGPYPNAATCSADHCGVIKYECQDGDGCTLLTGQAARDCVGPNCFDTEQDCLDMGCNNPYVCLPSNPGSDFLTCTDVGMGPSAGTNAAGQAQNKVDVDSYDTLQNCRTAGCEDRFECRGGVGNAGSSCVNVGAAAGEYANELACENDGCGVRFKCDYSGAAPACVEAGPGDNALDTYGNLNDCEAECETGAGEKFACIGMGNNTCVQVTQRRAASGTDPNGNTIYGSGYDTQADCTANCKFECSQAADSSIPGECEVGNTGEDSMADCIGTGCGTMGSICTMHRCETVANRRPAQPGEPITSGYGGPGNPWQDAVAGDGSGLAACNNSECSNYSWQCTQDDADPLNTAVCTPFANQQPGVTNPGMYATQELCEADCPNKYGCGNPERDLAGGGGKEDDTQCYKRTGKRANNDLGFYDTPEECVTQCTNFECTDPDQMACTQTANGSQSIYACADECYPRSFTCQSDGAGGGQCVEQKDYSGDYPTEAICNTDCPQQWYANKGDEGCHQQRRPTQAEFDAAPWLARTIDGYATQAECINDQNWVCTASASGNGATNNAGSPTGGSGGICNRSLSPGSVGEFNYYDACIERGRCGEESAECVDYTCVQRWDVRPQVLGNQYVGVCSVGDHSTQVSCEAAGGTWTSAMQTCQNDDTDRKCEKVSYGCVGEQQSPVSSRVVGGTCGSRPGPRDAAYPYSTLQECQDDFCGKFGANCEFENVNDQDKECSVVTGHAAKFATYNNDDVGHNNTFAADQECLQGGCQNVSYDCQVTFEGGVPTKTCVRRQDDHGMYTSSAHCEADGCVTGGGVYECVTDPNLQDQIDGKCVLNPNRQVGGYQTRADCQRALCGVNRSRCVHTPGADGAPGTLACEPDFNGDFPQSDGDQCADVCNSDTLGYRCEYPDGSKDSVRIPGSGVHGPFIIDWDDPPSDAYTRLEDAQRRCNYRCDTIVGTRAQYASNDPMNPTGVCAGPFPDSLPEGADNVLYDTLADCEADRQIAGACQAYNYKCGGTMTGGDCIVAYDRLPDAPDHRRYANQADCEVNCGAICDKYTGACEVGESGDPQDPDKHWFDNMDECNNGCECTVARPDDCQQYKFACNPDSGDCTRQPDGTFVEYDQCEADCLYMCNANDPNEATRCVSVTRADCIREAQQPGGGRTCYDNKQECTDAIAAGSCALVSWCNDNPGYCDARGLGEECSPLADNSGGQCVCPNGTVRSEFNNDGTPDMDSACVPEDGCIDDPNNPRQNCVHGQCTGNPPVCECVIGTETDRRYGTYGWLQSSGIYNAFGSEMKCVNQSPCGFNEYMEQPFQQPTTPIDVGRGANTAEGGVGDDRSYRCKECAYKTNADCVSGEVLDQRCSGTGTSDDSQCARKYLYCGNKVGNSRCSVYFEPEEDARNDADYEDLPRCSSTGERTGSEPSNAGSRVGTQGAQQHYTGRILPRYVNNGGQEDVDFDAWKRATPEQRANYGGYLNYYRFLVANQKLNICRHSGSVENCPGGSNCY